MKKAFTIIELLIVIFIFSSVMIMASSSFATSYIGGRTHSSSSMEANRSLSLVLDIIGQKMANASGYATLAGGYKYYGFRASAGVLTTFLQDNITCAYFVKDGDAMKMSQQNCLDHTPTSADYSGWEKISSPNIQITQFDILDTKKNEWSGNKTAPYFTVQIVGTDIKTKGKATLETTYSIPAYTYNKW